jgi:hypothetical protein
MFGLIKRIVEIMRLIEELVIKFTQWTDRCIAKISPSPFCELPATSGLSQAFDQRLEKQGKQSFSGHHSTKGIVKFV